MNDLSDRAVQFLAVLIISALAVLCSSCRGTLPVFTSEPESADVLKAKSLTESYYLRAGDLLSLTSPDSPHPYEARVDTGGNFSVPALGTFVAAGRTIAEVYAEIVKKDPRYQTHSLGFDSGAVYSVLGEVQAPGPKRYVCQTTVSQAIKDAGGFTKLANTNRVQLVRANGKKISVKLVGDARPKPSVFPGDSISVGRGVLARQPSAQ